MLGWYFLSKADDCFANVAWHVEMDYYSFVVTVERDSDVFGAIPIVGDGVVVIEDSREMMGVFFHQLTLIQSLQLQG